MKQNEFTNIIRQIFYGVFIIILSLIIVIGFGIHQIFHNPSEYSILANQNDNTETTTNMNIEVDNENATTDKSEI